MERKYRRRQLSTQIDDFYEVEDGLGWETCSLFDLVNDQQIGRLIEDCLSDPDGDNWCVATGYRGLERTNKAHIRIPDKINGKLVIGIGNPKSPTPFLYGRFDNEGGEFTPLYNVLSIRIPESVRFIVDDFVCPNLKDVNIPRSLEYIGSYSYCGYKKPTVTIPGCVRVISDHAFVNSSLQNVVIEEGVREIREEAFGDAIHLNTITLPKSLDFIDSTAFTHWRTQYGEHLSYASYSRFNLTNRNALQNVFRLCDATFFVPSDSYALRFVKTMGYTYEII